MTLQKHVLGWPIFTIASTPDNQVLIGGGGGATKAGVKNAVILCNTPGLEEVAEHVFTKQDDGCMSLGVHPKVNLADPG